MNSLVRSQIPRFRKEAFYSAADARQLAAKQQAPTGFVIYKNALVAQPHLTVKDPKRENVMFRSKSARFTAGDHRGDIAGIHPNFIRT